MPLKKKNKAKKEVGFWYNHYDFKRNTNVLKATTS